MTVYGIPKKIIKNKIKYYIQGVYNKTCYLPLGERNTLLEVKKLIIEHGWKNYRILKETTVSKIIKI
jgi:hypothetical protein